MKRRGVSELMLDPGSSKRQKSSKNNLPDLRYILAPMVGASELAFRLLCRKYGATLAYTPMMDAARFARDEEYRRSEFQTIPEDRPLVCHFCANDPEAFADAAKASEPFCDAIDLNLGCPQRTAYVGHFGSYLLDKKDRDLVIKMVKAAVKAVAIPICVKIRLLDTLDETVELVQQLRDAGASWIAIHARYRATWDRKGPGARDGPAMLDHIQEIKQRVPDIPIISNGNVITYNDVEDNLKFTGADGIMSAEGILDDPALFLPRYGQDKEKAIQIARPSPLISTKTSLPEKHSGDIDLVEKRKRKLQKKLRRVAKLEKKAAKGEDLIPEQLEKIACRDKLQVELAKLESQTSTGETESSLLPAKSCTTITLGDLYKECADKVKLAKEYLSLVRRYPIKIRTVVFHTRRMLRDQLTRYQLMDDCVAAQSLEEVKTIIDMIERYQSNPGSFFFDKTKEAKQKEALERKHHEEGKRRRFEERMVRKAKREGKADLEFYLRVGAELPTVETIVRLKSLSKEAQLNEWKKNHSQHCMMYHLDRCSRDRACAFLHVDARGKNTFDESEEVAG